MNNNAPPANWLNTDALLQKSRDKLGQVADQVKLLQTDSEYLRDYVLALKADRRWDDNVSLVLKWDHIAGKFAHEATAHLEMWHDVLTACTRLRDACQEHEGAAILRPGTAVSMEVSYALARLQKVLHDYKRFQSEQLSSAIRGMHAMKDTYSIGSDAGELYPRTVAKVPSTQSKHIHEALFNLIVAVKMRYCSSRPHVGALEAQLSTVRSDKRVQEHLSTLSLLDVLNSSVDWFQLTPRPMPTRPSPMPTRPPPKLEAHKPSERSESKLDDYDYDRNRVAIETSLKVSKEILEFGQAQLRFGSLGSLLGAACGHPLPKGPRGSLWLAKATEARHHLTTFWQTFRQTALEARKRVAPPTDESYPALVRRSFSFDVSRLRSGWSHHRWRRPDPPTIRPDWKWNLQPRFTTRLLTRSERRGLCQRAAYQSGAVLRRRSVENILPAWWQSTDRSLMKNNACRTSLLPSRRT